MKSSHISLCFPDSKRACFACCPPIRPAGYEHLPYKNILKRVLRENTRAFNKRDRAIAPITGFSCWALGYLDKACQLIGCLLHPAQNGGRDLRYRVNYGEKCQRETCSQAKTFAALNEDLQVFWLQMVAGLDTFSYSSRKFNPLFNMLDWGDGLLSQIADKELDRSFTWRSFSSSYPFFSTDLPPRGNAYLVNCATKNGDLNLLKNSRFKTALEIFSHSLSTHLNRLVPSKPEGPFVHLLGLDPCFLDFLRLTVHHRRLTPEKALVLKEIVDTEIQKFLGGQA